MERKVLTMSLSNEFDERFKEMKHIDRSNEARRTSLLKLESKVGKKNRYIAPIIVGIAMIAVATFLTFSLINTENPSNHLADEIASEDKNIAAVRAVLKSEFTVPNEEYILIQKNINKKMNEISQNLPEGSAGFQLPADSAELLAYKELVKKTYGPYYTDNAYEHLIPTNQAFQYHLSTELEEVRYQMNVMDIQVNQSKNESSPKNYDFVAQIEYTNNAGKVSHHEINGMAILSEVGRIGKLSIRDVGGLLEKINEDKGY